MTCCPNASETPPLPPQMRLWCQICGGVGAKLFSDLLSGFSMTIYYCEESILAGVLVQVFCPSVTKEGMQTWP